MHFDSIYDDKTAKVVAFAVLQDFYGESGYARDSANGALEAYFVSTLREVPKDSLGARLEELKADFGTLNAFKRAVARVKEFRGKNPVWRTFSV